MIKNEKVSLSNNPFTDSDLAQLFSEKIFTKVDGEKGHHDGFVSLNEAIEIINSIDKNDTEKSKSRGVLSGKFKESFFDELNWAGEKVSQSLKTSDLYERGNWLPFDIDVKETSNKYLFDNPDKRDEFYKKLSELSVLQGFSNSGRGLFGFFYVDGMSMLDHDSPLNRHLSLHHFNDKVIDYLEDHFKAYEVEFDRSLGKLRQIRYFAYQENKISLNSLFPIFMVPAYVPEIKCKTIDFSEKKSEKVFDESRAVSYAKTALENACNNIKDASNIHPVVCSQSTKLGGFIRGGLLDNATVVSSLESAVKAAYQMQNRPIPESSIKAITSGLNKLKDIKDNNFVESRPNTKKAKTREKLDLKFIDKDEENEAQFLSKKWQALFDEIIEKGYEFRYNVLTNVLEYKEKNKWQQNIDILISDIIFSLENNRGIKTISKSKVYEMLLTRKIVNVFNPIDDFIKKIPVWDGIDHIKNLCNYISLLGDESPAFFEEMIKKHLIRTLRCATDETNVNRIVTTFYGPQKIGKSKFWMWLTPRELYYDESIDLRDKDTFFALSRNLMINIDELDQLNKKETSKLKAFISKDDINKRLPYGKSEVRMIRVASFVATTNKLDILSDTENTRWIILKVAGFDWKNYTKEIDPLKVWSQALHLLNEDAESGELTNEEENIIAIRNEGSFLEVSNEREMLNKYFTQDNANEWLTATDIKQLLESKTYLKMNSYALNKEIKRLYGEAVPTSVGGKSGRYYKLKTLFFKYNQDGTRTEASGAEILYPNIELDKHEFIDTGGLPF